MNLDHAAEEVNIANKLKRFCNENGEETDSEEAAQILFELGLLYRKRSPDKLSLIKCIGLLNAAIARYPSNVYEIRTELNSSCSHVLKLANAVEINADLVKESNKVKQEITKLRNLSSKLISEIEHVKHDSKNTKETKANEVLYVSKTKNIQKKIFKSLH